MLIPKILKLQILPLNRLGRLDVPTVWPGKTTACNGNTAAIREIGHGYNR